MDSGDPRKRGLENDMPFDTRPKYSGLRAKYEQPLDMLVTLAALATLPVVVAQSRGNEAPWVVTGDWLIWGIFVLDYVFTVLVVEQRWAYTRQNWLNDYRLKPVG